MIDQVSPLGILEMQNAGVAATGACSGVFNLITTQAQGRLAFYMDAAPSVVAGASLLVYLQTSSNNSTWTNVAFDSGAQAAFTTVTNVASTGGVQAIYKASETSLSQYNRFSSLVTGSSTNFAYSIVAVYTQKNP